MFFMEYSKKLKHFPRFELQKTAYSEGKKYSLSIHKIIIDFFSFTSNQGDSFIFLAFNTIKLKYVCNYNQNYELNIQKYGTLCGETIFAQN